MFILSRGSHFKLELMLRIFYFENTKKIPKTGMRIQFSNQIELEKTLDQLYCHLGFSSNQFCAAGFYLEPNVCCWILA